MSYFKKLFQTSFLWNMHVRPASAFFSSGATNLQLIQRLKRTVGISDEVVSALQQVDRANYCLSYMGAYQDHPLPIGYNATISAPHMHGLAMKLMEPSILRNKDKNDVSILDVGSGSGYLAVCISMYLKGQGHVIGIEHIPELVEWSIDNVKKDGKGYLLEMTPTEECVEAPATQVSTSKKCLPPLTLMV